MDEEAIELRQEYEHKLDDVRREAAIDREQNRARTAKLEAELTESARNNAAEKLTAGMTKIHAEMATIRTNLAKDRPALAAQIASRVLGREVRS